MSTCLAVNPFTQLESLFVHFDQGLPSLFVATSEPSANAHIQHLVSFHQIHEPFHRLHIPNLELRRK